MNLHHLGIFHAVAQTGSVSRAAARLMVSQPAVSRQLKELEESTGTVLFERLPKGMRLTDAGGILAGYARRLFAIEADAEEALMELRGLKRGRLRVAAGTTIGVYLLPEVFVRFRRTYPGVETQLEMGSSQAVGRCVIEGAADVGFTQSSVEDDQLQSDVIMTDELVAIAPQGHPLARKRSITARMLCAEPWVVRESPGQGRSLVERALYDRGLRVGPVMALDSTEAIKRAVEAGLGVAMVSRLAVKLELETGRLAALQVSDFSVRRPVYQLRLRRGEPSKLVRAFLEILTPAASRRLA